MPVSEKPYSGMPCPVSGCHGHLLVYKTSTQGTGPEALRVRYLHCKTCGHKPENNKIVLPASSGFVTHGSKVGKSVRERRKRLKRTRRK